MANRLEVLKTYKLYINGKFPRTESGRYYKPENSEGVALGNICLASRKDFRNSVVAARKAQSAWAGRSAYNIGQILYRIAENMEGRKDEFSTLLQKEEGLSVSKAKSEVEQIIDRLIYFAGWSDKFQQIFSAVNPVASSHFNFSMQEAMGVVAILCQSKTGFKSFVSALIAAIAGGNSVVILADEKAPLSAITFAEVLHHSDLPGGVANILTGRVDELHPHFASHMDVNAILYVGEDKEVLNQVQLSSAENLKRFRNWTKDFVRSAEFENPYVIKDFLEVKTTWHPVEQIGGSAPAY